MASNRFSVELAVQQANTALNRLFQKLETTKTQIERLSPQGYLDEVMKVKRDKRDGLLSAFQKVIDTCIDLEKTIEVKQAEQSRKVKFTLSSDETLHLARKADFLNMLKLESPADNEIFDRYDKALELGLDEEVDFWENGGAYLLSSKLQAGKFMLKVKRNQEARYDDKLKADMEFAQKNLPSLKNRAQKIIDEINMTISIGAENAYIWQGLTIDKGDRAYTPPSLKMLLDNPKVRGAKSESPFDLGS